MNRHASFALLGLTLLLSACGGSSTTGTITNPAPVPVPSGTALTTLTGKLLNWPGIPATMTFRDFSSTNKDILAQGTAASDGSFSIELPNEATMATRLRKLDLTVATGCTSTITLSAPESRFFETSGFDVSVADKTIGSAGLGYSPTFFNPARKGDIAVHWLYVDRATTIQGASSCLRSTGTSRSETYDLRLTKGWNAASGEYLADAPQNGTNSTGIYTLKFTSEVSNGASWIYIQTPTP